MYFKSTSRASRIDDFTWGQTSAPMSSLFDIKMCCDTRSMQYKLTRVLEDIQISTCCCVRQNCRLLWVDCPNVSLKWMSHSLGKFAIRCIQVTEVFYGRTVEFWIRLRLTLNTLIIKKMVTNGINNHGASAMPTFNDYLNMSLCGETRKVAQRDVRQRPQIGKGP